MRPGGLIIGAVRLAFSSGSSAQDYIFVQRALICF